VRICVHGQPSERATDPTNLRLLLVADVLMRVVELNHVQVIVVLAGLASDEAGELLDLADRWGIHRPMTVSPGGDPATTLGGPVSVHVLGPGPSQDSVIGTRLQVGPLVADTEVVGRMQEDPAVLRLELLSRRYADPVVLRAGAGAGAEEALRRWRARMSDWARSPSRPIPPQIRQRAEANFADDLDTPSVLQLLGEIEADQNLPNGAKFETFAYLDRVLALELAREIGN
jgi:hypothetical protein